MYVIILLVVSVILLTGSVKFFGFEGMSKFYREVSLKIMNIATALMVIVLAARQLPREFENRTIYPLLAKPVSRTAFLAGKFLGVMLAGIFCYFIFIVLFLAGMAYLGISLSWGLFLQGIYLQILAFLIVASLSFMLSLIFNIDAAITVSLLVFLLGGTVSSAIDYIHNYVKQFGSISLGSMSVSVGDVLMRILNYGVPQLSLFDLTGKVVHATELKTTAEQVTEITRWTGIPAWVLGALTLYALAFSGVYLLIAHLLFKRRPL